MQVFNYHLSDPPDSTSCLPRLSLVDLEVTPPPQPSHKVHIFLMFFKDSGPVMNQLLLFFYSEIKAAALRFTADPSSQFSSRKWLQSRNSSA